MTTISGYIHNSGSTFEFRLDDNAFYQNHSRTFLI